jgi:hypothetical protein
MRSTRTIRLLAVALVAFMALAMLPSTASAAVRQLAVRASSVRAHQAIRAASVRALTVLQDKDLPAGGVFKDLNWGGTHLAAGIYSALVLWNLSPVLEIGFASTKYSSGRSTLSLTNSYFSAGAEWMFDWGGFIHAYVTYVHSIDISVSFDYADARAGTFEIATYGPLEPADGRAISLVRPGATIGYAF